MIEGMREREVENWLTPRRIAGSALVELAMSRQEMRSAPELQDVMDIVLRTFALGRCYRLASVAAAGRGSSVLGFWRREAPDAPIVHAAVLDPSSSLAADVLGVRLAGDLRAELEEAVGPIRLAILDPLAEDEFEPGERACLATIAAGMPWMEGGVAIPFGEWRDAVFAYQAFKGPGEA